MKVNKLIDGILAKTLSVTNIYKSSSAKLLTIEVETKNPIEYHTLIYKTEQQRDLEYLELDNKAFWSLSFNPNTPIPGPPM